MEAITVIAAVVAGIWGIVVFLRSGLLGGCLAVLLAGTCFGLPLCKIELGPLPLTIDRALLVLLVGQYLVWRRFGWVDPKPLGKPEIVLLLFTALMVLSTFSADWQASNYQPVAWLIIYYLMPAVVYWIARQANFSERAMLALFACFTLFGIYLALTSLAEYFKLWGLVFPSLHRHDGGGAGSGVCRPGRGPLLNPIANGILLAICFGSSLLWWPRLQSPGTIAAAVADTAVPGRHRLQPDPQRVDGRPIRLGAGRGVGVALELALAAAWAADCWPPCW